MSDQTAADSCNPRRQWFAGSLVPLHSVVGSIGVTPSGEWVPWATVFYPILLRSHKTRGAWPSCGSKTEHSHSQLLRKPTHACFHPPPPPSVLFLKPLPQSPAQGHSPSSSSQPALFPWICMQLSDPGAMASLPHVPEQTVPLVRANKTLMSGPLCKEDRGLMTMFYL